MASGYSSWFHRVFLYKVPFLYKKCPGGNYHLAWDRLCFCRMGEHCGDFHGGIYDFKTGEEYQRCKKCEEKKWSVPIAPSRPVILKEPNKNHNKGGKNVYRKRYY